MTATNHALTGAIIGLVVGEPLLALPLALVSHFVCDAIPHFGSRHSEATIKTKTFQNYLVVEVALCFGLVLGLAFFRPDHWLLAAICAFLATSPDLLWINRFRTLRQGRRWRPGWFSKFAAGIQWFQRPIGAVVEVAWFLGALVLIAPFIG